MTMTYCHSPQVTSEFPRCKINKVYLILRQARVREDQVQETQVIQAESKKP